MTRRTVVGVGAGAALALAAGVAALGQTAGQDRTRTFLEALRGANPIQCELALQNLNGWWGSDHEPVPDRNPQAWAVVATVTRNRTEPAMIPHLAAALRDEDGCVRRSAARLLGRSRAAAARARLLEALRDPNPAVRQLGAVGLGYGDEPSVESSLVTALRDRDPGVRAAAAWAIGARH